MLTGSPPYEGFARSNEEMIKLISSGCNLTISFFLIIKAPPVFPSDISEQCRDFLTKAFQFKPEDRPTAAELLDHPFVRGGI